MKILLVDDHNLVRSGLALVLKHMADNTEILEAESAGDAVTLAAETPGLDLVLMDLDLPDFNGLEAMQKINKTQPKLPVVILSGMEEAQTVSRALGLGARGFIPKSADGDTMESALRKVLAGDICMPPGFDLSELEVGSQSAPNLTQRQMEVLRVMAQGSSNKEIARELDISENTVRVHVSAIISALDAANRTEAVYSAMRLGLIERVGLSLG